MLLGKSGNLWSPVGITPAISGTQVKTRKETQRSRRLGEVEDQDHAKTRGARLFIKIKTKKGAGHRVARLDTGLDLRNAVGIPPAMSFIQIKTRRRAEK